MEAGAIIFGDECGFVYLYDRNFNKVWEHQLLQSTVRGIVLVSENNNIRGKQYIIVLGDELTRPSPDSKLAVGENSNLTKFLAIKVNN